MKIAIVGCSHGELERIYQRTQEIEYEKDIKIDLLICCGDFQSARNEADLRCMAIPPKFYNMRTFYKYYSGDRTAPFLTLFIGGNHEASNYLQEMPYGGWVAPNIYYLGYAGVVNYGGLRIGGLSGIFKARDYMKGHFERAPYDEDTKRSVYHVRNLEVFRLKQLSNTLDIMLSHDWPREVYTYGDVDELIRKKPFFEKEVNENMLGSAPCQELLSRLKPKNWFAAHLHTKFCAQVSHFNEDGSRIGETNFMALDKCLPRRSWIEVVDIPTTEDSRELAYDLEWLTILQLTDHLLSSKRTTQFMPGPCSGERWDFKPTNDEKEFVKRRMNDDLRVPTNFVRTAPFYNGYNRGHRNSISPPQAVTNPQTVILCEKLGIRDPINGVVENLNRSRSSNFGSYHSSPIGFSTPERCITDDPTYTSFDASDSRNGSFYSNRSSICSNTSFAQSPVPDSKKIKLSLPPIEHTSIDLTSADSSFRSFQDDSSFTIDRNGTYPETVDTEGESSDFLSFTIDRNGSIPETQRSTPSFKRRNASLYAEGDE